MDNMPGKRSIKSGLPAGSLIHIGEKKVEKVKIKLIDYSKDKYDELDIEEVSQCFPYKDDTSVTWINIDGLQDIKVLEELGRCFGFHPLVMEDILNTEQRPKVEEFADYIYVVLKMIDIDEKEKNLHFDQVSIIFGKNFVISFQEKPLEIYDPIIKRLKGKNSLLRDKGSDFIAYLLIDVIIDNYFKVSEKTGEKIERLEDKLVVNPTQKILGSVYKLKRDMLFMRKFIWPLREVVSRLERSQSLLISDYTKLYLRDIYDHIIQIIDTVETYREMLSGMIDIYLSSMSNRLNEVMKILTIFSTIFIPLTFIASIYGMNFKFMPELISKFGYPAVWVIMAGVSIFMIFYFKRKKWF
ncbi:MAG TPA: magnesium/cobalt transporter CorA [Candidatus Humimicrobiaceae bacterium]